MSHNQSSYLDYLDKEMSIMGILSTFCVIVVAGTSKEILEADKGLLCQMAASGFGYFMSGSVVIMVAAFLFYYQRSILAYHYGQISLFVAKETKKDLPVANLAGSLPDKKNEPSIV